MSEFSIFLLAVSLPVLARHPGNRRIIRAAAAFVLPLFLCYWLPQLLSSFDSYDPGKSWVDTAATIRFPAAALAMAVVLQGDESRRLVLRLTTFILLFWAGDAFVQLALGRDIFGIPMHEDRLNALFYRRHQFFGPTLAILSPLALEYTRRHWPAQTWLLALALIFGAVLIAGMRAGWVMMAVVMAAYMIRLFRDPDRRLQAFSIPLVALLTLAASLYASPLLQQRLQLTGLLAAGSEAALNEALSDRIPIFRTALTMYRQHPVNGVGVRAFPDAYPVYAAEDDIHLQKHGGEFPGSHAHNIVLEFMADTGTIGLIGLVLGFVLAWWFWRSLGRSRRDQAFPFALALLAVVFPVNSHFAFFGVYTSSLTWFLIGLIAAVAASPQPGGHAESNQRA